MLIAGEAARVPEVIADIHRHPFVGLFRHRVATPSEVARTPGGQAGISLGRRWGAHGAAARRQMVYRGMPAP